MPAGLAVSPHRSRHLRHQLACRPRVLRSLLCRKEVVPAPGPWARFWNDRQAVALKIALLVGCLLAAAALEVPW